MIMMSPPPTKRAAKVLRSLCGRPMSQIFFFFIRFSPIKMGWRESIICMRNNIDSSIKNLSFEEAKPM